MEEHVRSDPMFQMDSPSTSNGHSSNFPYIKIIEQPASKALRFRYQCESSGCLFGANSTTKHKTYPTIQIVGYKGRAVVVVSCVTVNKPFHPHPYNLVGRDNCKRGICTIEIENDQMTASFQNLGIQCVKKKDIDDALKIREEIGVDPFRTGFSHKVNPSSINLNAVRLCFQAFLGSLDSGKYCILEPVISDPIYDKKAMSDFMICNISDTSCSVEGGKNIILLCEKVAKDDIKIRFFEERNGICTWEDYAEFQPSDVHKQVAISFRTPSYKTLQIDHPVCVSIQLKRPSDGMCGEACSFIFTPIDSVLTRENSKFTSQSDLLRQFKVFDPTCISKPSIFIERENQMLFNQMNIPIPPIKEVSETSSNSFGDLYSLQNPDDLAQPQTMCNSRTLTSSDYMFLNQVNPYEQLSTNINVSRLLSAHNPQPPIFIERGNQMLFDQMTIPIPPIKEVSETSSNSHEGLYSLQNPSVLAQPQTMYNSKTPSLSEYVFPNQVNPYGQPSNNINVVRPLSVKNQTSGCFATKIGPTLNNQITSSSAISVPSSPITSTSQFQCPLDIMDEFSSQAGVDSNDLEVFCEDISMIRENDQQSLSANVCASLYLADSNPMISPNAAVQESINMSDSLDRIAKSIINDFPKCYSKNDHH